MCPIITFGEIKILTFPLVLLMAVFICVVYYIESKKYCIDKYIKIMESMVFAAGFAWIGGSFLSAITLMLKNGLSLWDNLFKGFVFYGALIGAIIGLSIYCTFKGEVLLDYLDVFMGILPLGQSIGRMGCYFNGCCYGKAYNGIGVVMYPVNGVITGVFPTWFLESFFCSILFLCIQFGVSTRKRGFYTAIYFISYSIFRFGIEFMRGDEVRGVWKGISTSQIISIFLFFYGCGILVYIMNFNKKINYFIVGKDD